MNGLIRSVGAGVALVALFSVGCCSTRSSCGTCKNSNACDGSAGKCNAGLRDRLENFDYEQLHTDHCWPEQYARESWRRVDAPMGQQMKNGMALESTIWAYYFSSTEGKEHELNSAGMARIEYLARKKPYIVPDLFLQTSFDRTLDEKRTKTVIDYAAAKSFEPVGWNVTLVNREPSGLFGREAPKAIDKMVGIADTPPRYEPQIKAGFLQGVGGAGAGGGR